MKILVNLMLLLCDIEVLQIKASSEHKETKKNMTLVNSFRLFLSFSLFQSLQTD